MKLFILFLFAWLPSAKILAQAASDTSKISTSDDAMASSDFDLSTGFGNGEYSTKNNARNAEQSDFRQIFFTETAIYHHKSGFGLGASSFNLTRAEKFAFYQFDLNPFYNFESKSLATGISLTHFLPGAKTTVGANPYRNETEFKLRFRHPWLEPALTLDYGAGKTTDEFDSIYILPGPAQKKITYTDKSVSDLRDFTASFSLQHEFSFASLLAHDDGLSVTGAAALNTGNSRLKTFGSLLHTGGGVHSVQRTRNYSSGNNQGFKPESVSLDSDVYYSISKYFFESDLYADYFLPKTTTARLTLIYAISAGISF